MTTISVTAEVAVEEVVDVTIEDHVAVIAVVVVAVVEEVARISRSSMKMLSQLSEAGATAKAATRVNIKSLD